MTRTPAWTQISPRHFVIERSGSRIELRYQDAGFQSAWGVYANGALVQQRPDFMQARGIASTLAAGR